MTGSVAAWSGNGGLRQLGQRETMSVLLANFVPLPRAVRERLKCETRSRADTLPFPTVVPELPEAHNPATRRLAEKDPTIRQTRPSSGD